MESIHATQHYSSTYPSQSQFNHSSVPPSFLPVPVILSMNDLMLWSQQGNGVSNRFSFLKDPGVPTEQAISDKFSNNAAYKRGLDPMMILNVMISPNAKRYQNPFYLKKAQRIKPTLYDGTVISDKHVAMPVINDEETLILEEDSRSKMSEKEKDLEAIKQNISHKPINYEKLNRLSEDFRKRFTLQQELSAKQAFWLRMSNPTSKHSHASPVKIEAPKELP
ncbi:hypothetical protein Tco_1132064 [Tanacetum coccineum]|uniref:Uncharacterized protein n=1 Tax=Tanacetum coccineum TaxID=301880 RepID=A0ABQ5JAX6_9ASTR